MGSTGEEKKTSVFLTALKWAVLLFLATVGVMVVFGLILGRLEGLSQGYLLATFGWFGIIITGGIGTPVHELSHYIMCKVFGYRVHELVLFRPFAAMQDGVLGYVSFSKDPTNLWQTLGSFFVGTAPMIFGPLLVLLLFRLMMPGAYQKVNEEIGTSLEDDNISIAAIFKMVFVVLREIMKQILDFDKKTFFSNFLFLYLTLCITSHTTLSTADIQNSLAGMAMVFGIFFLIGLLTAIAKQNIAKDIMKIALLIGSFFMMALAFSALGTALAYLFFVIKSVIWPF